MDRTKKIEGVFSTVAAVRERGNQLIERELTRRGIEGIVPAHGVVFAALFEAEEPIPLKQIVERSRRVKSTITGMVRTLEKYGYVRRERSEEDGRSWNISLTPRGQGVRADFESISTMLVEKAYDGFDTSEREVLVTLLHRMLNNLPNPE